MCAAGDSFEEISTTNYRIIELLRPMHSTNKMRIAASPYLLRPLDIFCKHPNMYHTFSSGVAEGCLDSD